MIVVKVSDMQSYNVKEIADLLQTNPETVRRWIRKGRLAATRGPSRKEGSSVSAAALQEFLEKSPKYSASVAAFISLPTAMLSISLFGVLKGIAAIKTDSDDAIENASVNMQQMGACIKKEIEEHEASIARKKETVDQLKREIGNDERYLEELLRFLERMNLQSEQLGKWSEDRSDNA
jgi:excisionase family DNA binding protein